MGGLDWFYNLLKAYPRPSPFNPVWNKAVCKYIHEYINLNIDYPGCCFLNMPLISADFVTYLFLMKVEHSSSIKKTKQNKEKQKKHTHTRKSSEFEFVTTNTTGPRSPADGLTTSSSATEPKLLPSRIAWGAVEEAQEPEVKQPRCKSQLYHF